MTQNPQSPQSPFQIQLVEMYYGVPILEVSVREPTILTPETHQQLALLLLEQPYEHMAVVVDFRNMSHGANFGPEEEAESLRKEPFAELSRRVVTIIRFQAVSMTSLVHGMRVSMLARNAVRASFAPDFGAAVRGARRAIDRMQVPTT